MNESQNVIAESAEEVVKLPTLVEFLDEPYFPNNSYLEYPGFNSLYVRKGTIGITINGKFMWCNRCLTIASVIAEKPGKGAFTVLVNDLIDRGLAIYVESVLNPRFRKSLARRGWTQVNISTGFMFLCNYKGHLMPERI